MTKNKISKDTNRKKALEKNVTHRKRKNTNLSKNPLSYAKKLVNDSPPCPYTTYNNVFGESAIASYFFAEAMTLRKDGETGANDKRHNSSSLRAARKSLSLINTSVTSIIHCFEKLSSSKPDESVSKMACIEEPSMIEPSIMSDSPSEDAQTTAAGKDESNHIAKMVDANGQSEGYYGGSTEPDKHQMGQEPSSLNISKLEESANSTKNLEQQSLRERLVETAWALVGVRTQLEQVRGLTFFTEMKDDGIVEFGQQLHFAVQRIRENSKAEEAERVTELLDEFLSLIDDERNGEDDILLITMELVMEFDKLIDKILEKYFNNLSTME